MLAPHNRTQLLESLRPPAGYRLSDAIATTYSLDLLALLVAPVGFTSFELQDSDGPIIGDGDTLMLLRTIRRHADHMTIFCQAGQIAPAPLYSRLLTALEPCVVEVTAPLGGVFHPKVWVLRYVAVVPEFADSEKADENVSESSVRYRVLVATRNLTFDRSWDTVLTLDGVLSNRKRAFAVNRPLSDFIARLPTLAIHKSVSTKNSSRAMRLADELLRVEFTLPTGFDTMTYHPLGIASSNRSPFIGRMDKLLVVSPYLSATELQGLGGIETERTLVSRAETIASLPTDILKEWTTMVLNQDADGIEEPAESGTDADEIASVPAKRGLHAKLYVADAGHSATVWTGSANATTSAFSKNVEFLVELGGKRSVCGVEAMLGSTDGTTSLRDLLLPYQADSAQSTFDEETMRLDRTLDETRRALASLGWQVVASISEESGKWFLELRSVEAPTASLWKRVASLSARPITLNDSHSRHIDQSGDGCLAAAFIDVSLASITAFIALSLSVEVEGKRAETSFVVTVELKGAPDSRHEAILRHLLQDRTQVLQFLRLLLTDDLHGFGGGQMPIYGRALLDGAERPAAILSEALLEPLLRVLHRSPERLDEIEQFAHDLAPRGPDDAVLLPEGFSKVVSILRSACAVLK